nr:ribonuclease H-like domain-containing protein [Tanacetum cinerariifolium]
MNLSTHCEYSPRYNNGILMVEPTISTLKQNGSSIADYYHKLNTLWKHYDAMIELPKCVCNASESFKKHNQLLKLIQFLMGLDDSYMQIRSSILSREVLPDVRSAYATIFSEESHIVVVGNIVGSSQRNQAYAIVSNVPNRNNFQRNQTSSFTQRDQDLNLKNVLRINDECEGLYYYNNQVDNNGDDTYRSDELVATQNEEVATLEENVVSEGIDYEDTFSHVVKMVTVRCLLNIIMCMSWPAFQLDVNNAFLYGDLEEVVYMKPLEGYFSFDNKSKYDYSLYTKSNEGVFLSLLVYVDDIIITGNSTSEIEKFKVFLKFKFMIKDLGKLKYFLGIEVVDTDKCICLNKRKYVLDLLSEYGMLACKSTKTPLIYKLVISNKAFENDHLLENVIDYNMLMGKLIYLTNTRPDISYVVHCLSQFMHSSLSSHLKIAFKILRYLNSCPGLGIHITRTFGMFLNAYSDVDWAKCIVTRKLVTGANGAWCLLGSDGGSWGSSGERLGDREKGAVSFGGNGGVPTPYNFG